MHGNGKIDSRAELFGGVYGEGFSLLSTLDSNGDGQINAADEAFLSLRLWQDKNSNKETDEGELISLSQGGIGSISLSYTMNAQWDEGNLLLEQSQATRTDGAIIEVRDAYFEIESEASVLPKPSMAATQITLPPTLLARLDEDEHQEESVALLKRTTQASVLPWPIRSMSAGQVQASKPVIDWGNLNRQWVQVNTSAEAVKTQRESEVQREENQPERDNEAKPSKWLSGLLKRWGNKR